MVRQTRKTQMQQKILKKLISGFISLVTIYSVTALYSKYDIHLTFCASNLIKSSWQKQKPFSVSIRYIYMASVIYQVGPLFINVLFTISALTRCSVPLYLQLFVGGLMSYLRYLSLFSYSGIQHILCCVLFFFVLCTQWFQFL